MHWILTIPDGFSLAEILTRSCWLLHPPFSIGKTNAWLERVERFASGRTTMLTIRQTAAGLLLRINDALTGTETEEASHKTWRMLRLGENLTPFLDRARKDPALRLYLRQGARFLRGTTFFEDLIKALITTNAPDELARHQIAGLVDRLGDPLPSNPTHHAFPTPRQLRQEPAQLHDLFGANMGRLISASVAHYLDREELLESLAGAQRPLAEIEQEVAAIPGASPYCQALMMLALGRYDYLPQIPFWQLHSQTQDAVPAWEPKTGERTFDDWQPWGGLVFWLRNWEHVPQACRFEGERV
ncbi:MAG: hypothetical protein JXB35_03920 [Anaerolineae bacterium]|nr:hypothetical protein [Anaerolineae bacterium]